MTKFKFKLSTLDKEILLSMEAILTKNRFQKSIIKKLKSDKQHIYFSQSEKCNLCVFAYLLSEELRDISKAYHKRYYKLWLKLKNTKCEI